MLLSLLRSRGAAPLVTPTRWTPTHSMSRSGVVSYSTLRRVSSSEGFRVPRPLLTSGGVGGGVRGKKTKKGEEPDDIRVPRESLSEFEVEVYRAHYLNITTTGTLLKLSGLYSQATRGPNTTKEPPKSETLDHAHWVAWKQLGDMRKEEAEKEYVALVNLLRKNAKSKPDVMN